MQHGDGADGVMRGCEDNSDAAMIVVCLTSFEENSCVLTLFEEPNILSGYLSILKSEGVLHLRGCVYKFAESEEARECDFKGRVEVRYVDVRHLRSRARQ